MELLIPGLIPLSSELFLEPVPADALANVISIDSGRRADPLSCNCGIRFQSWFFSHYDSCVDLCLGPLGLFWPIPTIGTNSPEQIYRNLVVMRAMVKTP